LGGWTNKGLVVEPGAAIWVFIPEGAGETTMTLIGEVPQGEALTTPLEAGFSTASSQVPQAGLLETDLGFPAADGDNVIRWDAVGQTYRAANQYLDLFGGWVGGEPAVEVGEGFWVLKGEAVDWIRSFSVND
jgi:hypothetical protein